MSVPRTDFAPPVYDEVLCYPARTNHYHRETWRALNANGLQQDLYVSYLLRQPPVSLVAIIIST